MAYSPLCRFPPGRFAMALSPPWLVRPLACSPPYRRTWYHCDTTTETLCLQPFFHSFPRFFISITFIQRKTTVQQHYKSKSFPTNPKAKVIFYYLQVYIRCAIANILFHRDRTNVYLSSTRTNDKHFYHYVI